MMLKRLGMITLVYGAGFSATAKTNQSHECNPEPTSLHLCVLALFCSWIPLKDVAWNAVQDPLPYLERLSWAFDTSLSATQCMQHTTQIWPSFPSFPDALLS